MANTTIASLNKPTFKQFGGSETNTGSIRAQIAMLTQKINHISSHIKNGNKKDHSSNRGLLKMVGQRRKFLAYYAKNDINGYRELISELGLRK